jgi:hypothetical protein
MSRFTYFTSFVRELPCGAPEEGVRQNSLRSFVAPFRQLPEVRWTKRFARAPLRQRVAVPEHIPAAIAYAADLARERIVHLPA